MNLLFPGFWIAEAFEKGLTRGTGVLFPDYIGRGVASMTGIDISPEMARIARCKFSDVEVICGDATTAELSRQFGAYLSPEDGLPLPME